MTIEQEIQQLRSISSIGLALVAFTRAIHPKGDFTLESRSWIYRPDNFVTLEVHFQRANNITLSLRGITTEFEEYPVLPLTSGHGACVFSL